MKLELVKLDTITPYEQNPRHNEDAVDKVAKSIKDYGYNQPIVVDEDYVVIAGHTRLKALEKLGWKKVHVVVAPLSGEKARKLRIADNKSGEMAVWDRSYLIAELREFEGRAAYFSESELTSLLDENVGIRERVFSSDQMDRRKERLDSHHKTVVEKSKANLLSFQCKHCGEEFAIQRDNAIYSHGLDTDSKASVERKQIADEKAAADREEQWAAETEGGQA